MRQYAVGSLVWAPKAAGWVRHGSSSAHTLPQTRPLKIAIKPFPPVSSQRATEDVTKSLAADLFRAFQEPKGRTVGSGISRIFSLLWAHFITPHVGVDDIREKTQLNNFRQVYLPYWTFDACLSLDCRSGTAKARAKAIFENAYFAAHTDQVLSSAPFDILSIKDGDYDALDVQKHLQGKVAGRQPEVVPFALSPLSLVDLFGDKDELFKAYSTTSPSSENVNESTPTNFPERADITEIELDTRSLELEFMAMSPVLLPFYVAELSNTSHRVDERLQMMTLAIFVGGAQMQIAVRFHRLENDNKPEWYGARFSTELSALRPKSLFFTPRVPTPNRLQELSKIVHDKDEEAREQLAKAMKEEREKLGTSDREWESFRKRWDQAFKDQGQTFTDLTKSAVKEALARDNADSDAILNQLCARLERALKGPNELKAISLMQQAGFKAMQKRKGLSEDAPESQAGLGDFFDWDQPAIIPSGGDEGQRQCAKLKEYLYSYSLFQKYRLELHADEVAIGSHAKIGEERLFVYRGGESAKTLLMSKARDLGTLRPAWLIPWLKDVQDQRASIQAEKLKGVVRDEYLEDVKKRQEKIRKEAERRERLSLKRIEAERQREDEERKALEEKRWSIEVQKRQQSEREEIRNRKWQEFLHAARRQKKEKELLDRKLSSTKSTKAKRQAANAG